MDEENAIDAGAMAYLQKELEHRERQIAAIRRISEALFTRASVDEVVRQTLTVAIDVLNADAGSLQMYDAASDSLVFRYVSSPSHQSLIGHTVPTAQGISGRVFRSGVSDLAEDVSNSADFNPAIDLKTGYRTHSALTVPLKRASGVAIGVMQVLNLARRFNQHDLEVLEVLGAQAATAIANVRLAELARQAEVVNVIGNVSHDIYNMLTPLKAGITTLQPMLNELFARLEILRSQCLQTPADHRLDGPMMAAELEKLITEAGSDYGWILDMMTSSNQRVQARTRWIAGAVKGKLPEPVFEEGDLNITVREVFSALATTAQQRRVELRLDLDESLPHSRFDPEHIYNALYNLVHNALPSTQAGGWVSLRTRALHTATDQAETAASQKATIVIEVVDNGQGMTPEVRDKLFTDTAISTKPDGTGLGTRVVKHVVDQHQGTIEIESAIGRGSTFRIRLPLSPD